VILSSSTVILRTHPGPLGLLFSVLYGLAVLEAVWWKPASLRESRLTGDLETFLFLFPFQQLKQNNRLDAVAIRKAVGSCP